MHNLPVSTLPGKLERRASANLIPIRILPVFAAALICSAFSAHAQDVAVTGLLSDVPAPAGVFDYTLTLQNTGSEAIESLWLGWALSSNPIFDVASPTDPGNDLGWDAVIDGDSVQFGGSSSETFLAPHATATFTFDSTSTPAEFMSQAAGQSVAYGVNASQFAIEDNSLNSVEFAPTVAAVPEPSTLGLLIMAVLGISLMGWPRRSKAISPCL